MAADENRQLRKNARNELLGTFMIHHVVKHTFLDFGLKEVFINKG